MARKMILTLFIVTSAMLLPSCGPQEASPTPEADMPNPASVYCEDNGGRVELRQDASGNTGGFCVFADGSECEEWAYYRGECKPSGAQTDATPAADMPNPASVCCEENGGKVDLRQDSSGGVVGICVFADGSECDEWAYFRGECKPSGTETDSTPVADMPNPASVYCEENGGTVELRQDALGGVAGICVFPDGSECDEWAYFRGECGPGNQYGDTAAPIEIPTALPIDPALYQDWQTYTNAAYGFSLMLPRDWVAEDIAANDPLLGGHLVNLHPQAVAGKENIRMTFRRVGEEVLLWPTGVGQGDFVPQGTLDVYGQPSRRVLLVCPTGEVTAIWYHQDEAQPNIERGDLEFGFIFTAASHCEAGYSLSGDIQQQGEMIIASLNVP